MAVENVLKNAIDMHLHCAPDTGPRYGDSVEIATIARAAGMRVNAFLNEYTDEVIAELIKKGAFIELSYGALAPRHGRQDPHVCARLVDRFGPTRCILESDPGTWENISASAGTFLHLGHALWGAGRLEEAVSAYKKVLQLSPNDIWAHLRLAGTYMMMGRENEARAEAAEVLRINPKFSLDDFGKNVPYKDQAVVDKLINACRKAGLK
jgi:tetratricopeptide (TPR) repeat protein